ncbi:10334_t:CDS:1 [Acaulospora morrowiae]|uniref:10334_t:CDS:1 n=1 Tax=Acaulospora morrowiae TaxID=94023 RepID=A0A9N9FGY1_9GLOM|nr:10334_t:CDS:1 [Acaulospora morrowiae]
MEREPQDPLLDLQLVSSSVSRAFRLFTNCETMESKNTTIMKAIESVTNQRNAFYTEARKSIACVEALRRHAEDVLNYIKILQDQENTLEDRRSSLDKLLEDAKENRAKWITMKESFEQIRGSLSATHTELTRHKFELPAKERERKSKKRNLDELNSLITIKYTVAAGSMFFCILLFVFSALPDFHYLQHAAQVCLVAGISVFYWVISDHKTIRKIKDELDEMDDTLDNSPEKIKDLRGTLDPIVECMVEFEVFWETEENRISHLIRNLESNQRPDDKDLLNWSISTAPIRNKWCGVQQQCDSYRNVVSQLLKSIGD